MTDAMWSLTQSCWTHTPSERLSSDAVVAALFFIADTASTEVITAAIRRVSESTMAGGPENSETAISSSLAFLAFSNYVATEKFLSLLKEHWATGAASSRF